MAIDHTDETPWLEGGYFRHNWDLGGSKDWIADKKNARAIVVGQQDFVVSGRKSDYAVERASSEESQVFMEIHSDGVIYGGGIKERSRYWADQMEDMDAAFVSWKKKGLGGASYGKGGGNDSGDSNESGDRILLPDPPPPPPGFMQDFQSSPSLEGGNIWKPPTDRVERELLIQKLHELHCQLLEAASRDLEYSSLDESNLPVQNSVAEGKPAIPAGFSTSQGPKKKKKKTEAWRNKQKEKRKKKKMGEKQVAPSPSPPQRLNLQEEQLRAEAQNIRQMIQIARQSGRDSKRPYDSTPVRSIKEQAGLPKK